MFGCFLWFFAGSFDVLSWPTIDFANRGIRNGVNRMMNREVRAIQAKAEYTQIWAVVIFYTIFYCGAWRNCDAWFLFRIDRKHNIIVVDALAWSSSLMRLVDEMISLGPVAVFRSLLFYFRARVHCSTTFLHLLEDWPADVWYELEIRTFFAHVG